jgi:putative ABC transport system permease protein
MLSDLIFRWRALFRRSSVERELDDELRFHIEGRAAIHMRSGAARDEALRRARIELAGAEQVKEACRDARGTRWAEDLAKDLRYAARSLAKSPGFTAIAILSLALGIGANTAIFQLLDTLRLRMLPVRAPQELLSVRIADMRGARGSVNHPDSVTYRIWEQIAARQTAFSDLFAWSEGSVNLSPSGEARMANIIWITGGLFPGVGVEPLNGRLFTSADDRRGCGTPGAVVSYGFWKSELGGDPSVVGRKLTLNGHTVDIIGVTRPGFFGLNVGRAFQIALPVCSQPVIGAFNALDQGTFWWLAVMGRVKPGWTVERAAASVAAISPAVFESSLPPRYPAVSVKSYLAMRLTAGPASTGTSGMRSDYSEPLWILLTIAAVVLTIACANLANLMLARSSAREREIAVRLAIGAGRGRLVRQLMTESLAIAGGGGAVGLVLARGLSRALVSLLATGDNAVYLDLNPDWRVLGFAMGLAALTAMLFGLVPAVRATQAGPADVLRSAGRGITIERNRFHLRRMLVVAQMALSLVLLVAALLFTGTLRNLVRTDAGFRPEGVLVADLGFARAAPLTIPVLDWQRRLLERLRTIPGVAAVADTDIVPLAGASRSNAVWMDGADSLASKNVRWSRVSAGYFQSMGIALKAGRDFDEQDGPGTPNAAVVNELFAKRVAGTPNPVGMRFHVEQTPSTPETVYQVAGVVANTKYGSVRGDLEPLFYLAMTQDPHPQLNDQLLIRCGAAPANVIPGIRRALSELDSGARFQLYGYQDLIRDSLLRERIMALLAGGFGVLAALLSAIGLYGVVSYVMARRRGEIGIRVALGAGRREILTMVLADSGRLAIQGLAVGLVLALIAGSFAGKLLFGVKPYDPATLVAASALMIMVALAASYLPAWRASRLDPMGALREE